MRVKIQYYITTDIRTHARNTHVHTRTKYVHAKIQISITKIKFHHL